MTREIKASEVREGMEVEWSKGGITYKMQCQLKVEFKHSVLKEISGYNFCAEDGGVQRVSVDQTVTVLAEPQPDEPTAFGACVEAAGRKYVRADNGDGIPWAQATPNGYNWFDWEDICATGHVTVVNADPFASTEQREPRVWDRWADVPGMTPVCVSYGVETLYRKREGRVERRQPGSWVPVLADEYDLNERSPLTEVLVSTVS